MHSARLCCLAAALLAASCNRSGSSPAGGESAQPAAAGWTVTVQPGNLPAAAGSNSPQLTASADGVISSWIEQKEQTSTLRFSQRTADGWSAPRTVASGTDWFVSWADVPSVMRLRSGGLVAHWLKAVDPLTEAYDLRLAHSEDGGATWSRPVVPHHDGTKTQHGFASLVEAPGGGLGLVWLDGRDMELNTTDPEGGSMALFYAGFDAAWKQTAETIVNARVCECCPTSAVMTSDGLLTAFRDRSDREIRDIHVSRLENGAWTPPVIVHADNWEIPSCPVNGPSLSARGRQVAAAWFTTKDDRGQAYVAFSPDAGRTWGAPVRLDEGQSLGHVDVEMLDDGSAVASWVEFADQRGHFRIRRVEASGATSPVVEIAGGAGRVTGYPRMARRGDELLFSWTESAGGDEESGQQVKGAVARLPR